MEASDGLLYHTWRILVSIVRWCSLNLGAWVGFREPGMTHYSGPVWTHFTHSHAFCSGLHRNCDSQSVLSRVIRINANETIFSPKTHLLHAYCAAGAELGPGTLSFIEHGIWRYLKQWICFSISINHVASGFWFKDFLSKGSQMLPRKTKIIV